LTIYDFRLTISSATTANFQASNINRQIDIWGSLCLRVSVVNKNQSVLVNSGTCSVLALASIISSTRLLGADSCSRVVGSGPLTVK